MSHFLGELLGALCQVIGIEIYQLSKDVILDLVTCNLERQPASHLIDEEEEEPTKDGEKPTRRRVCRK